MYSIKELETAITEICQNNAADQEKVRKIKHRFLFQNNEKFTDIFLKFFKPFFPTMSSIEST